MLLWQYLKHRNVMDLVTLSLSQEAAPRASSDECFLATLGVPIVQWALQQVWTPKLGASVSLTTLAPVCMWLLSKPCSLYHDMHTPIIDD